MIRPHSVWKDGVVMKEITLFCVMALLGSMAFAGPPSSSGVVVRRSSEAPRIWWYSDDARGLGLAVGSDVVADCSEEPLELILLSFSDKDIQDGLRLVALRKAEDVGASVWSFTEFDCDKFLTELPLATGEVDRSVHDNDFFGNRYCEVKNNMNAFSHSIHGTLYSPFGEKRQLSAHYWGLFDCDTQTLLNNMKILLTD